MTIQHSNIIYIAYKYLRYSAFEQILLWFFLLFLYPFLFKCRSCKEFIYTDSLSEEDNLYNCENCEAGNWINSDFEGLIEIDKDEISNHPSLTAIPKSVISIQRKPTRLEQKNNLKNRTLSEKYAVLDSFKVLAFFLMIGITGGFIYQTVQYFDLPELSRKILENFMIYTTVSYVITMFSLFCLTKIIDFLFDLDKKTNT